MEKAKFPFQYGNEEAILWAWKGDYINLGAGAELGIYHGGEPHWQTGTAYAMPMTLTLNYNGEPEPIISYDPRRDDPKGRNRNTDKWWITGFDPSHQGVQASELRATYTVDFSGNKDMYKAFSDTWDGVYDSAGNIWTFNPETYKASLTF